jgi:succinate dehydrogenase flavin-adding protein (antitoxin of CptAB toxin-antitoxin module)
MLSRIALNKLMYRAGKRGMKENEIVLKRLAEGIRHDEVAIASSLEAFLNEEDNNINQWILGQRPFPPEYVKSGLVERIMQSIHN